MRSSLRTVRNLLFIVMMLVILYAYAMFQGGFVSWFLFFSYLPILLYQFCLFVYPLHDIKVTRKFSSAAIFAGDTLHVTIEIKRSLPFPLLYTLVEEKLPDSLKRIDIGPRKYRYVNRPAQLTINRNMKQAIFPLFRRKMELTYEIKQIPRGEHVLEHIEIETGDIFGFIKKKVHLQSQSSLLVYPAERQLIMNKQTFNSQQGALMNSVWHFHYTNMATGVREYVPGDKYSWIDWKQTAKNNHIMTKEFDQEKNQELLIILDRTKGSQFNPLLFEAAVELTNALINSIDQVNSMADFISIGKETKHFSLANEHDIQIASRYLALTQPSSQQSFTKQFQYAIASYRRVTICLITTQLDIAFVEVMKQIETRSQGIVVVLLQRKQDTQTNEHRHLSEQLSRIGVQLVVLTEQELVRNYLEVNL